MLNRMVSAQQTNLFTCDGRIVSKRQHLEIDTTYNQRSKKRTSSPYVISYGCAITIQYVSISLYICVGVCMYAYICVTAMSFAYHCIFTVCVCHCTCVVTVFVTACVLVCHMHISACISNWAQVAPFLSQTSLICTCCSRSRP